MSKNYHLLDIERNYKKNDEGSPSTILFSVESIGFMDASTIVTSSTNVLLLNLLDIRNSIHIEEVDSHLSFDFDDKLLDISIDTYHENSKGISIKIFNQNHTIGNLIRHYLVSDIELDNPIKLKFAGYKKNHPTIEEIEFLLYIQDSLDLEQLQAFNTKILNLSSKNNDLYQNILIYCSIHFLRAVNSSIKDIEKFLNLFHKQFPSYNSYDIHDDLEAYKKINSQF